MSQRHYPQRRKAAQMLLLATVLWGVSFPTVKALAIVQQALLPDASTWFLTGMGIMARFGVATLLMLAWVGRDLRALSRIEIEQGAGIGLFGGLGMLFQVDGLAHTDASTSAFLTQAYCLILPFMVALRDRTRPSPILVVCSVLLITGVGILSKVDWRTLTLGRGEAETLAGSLMFALQILWLERPRYAAADSRRATVVMFATMTLVACPVALATTERAQDWIVAFAHPATAWLSAILIVFCTLMSFVLMVRWQPGVPAVEAGLIYGIEPLFASAFALFLPAWFALAGGFDYANERLTSSLMLGGALVTGANILIQLGAHVPAPAAPVTVAPEPDIADPNTDGNG